MGLKEFFLDGALEYGIPSIKIEIVKNTGSKRRPGDTFKITDNITGREYFIRSGINGHSWATVKCSPTRTWGGRMIQQYSVLSLKGGPRKLNIYDSVFVIERHIAKQRKKLQKVSKKG